MDPSAASADRLQQRSIQKGADFGLKDVAATKDLKASSNEIPTLQFVGARIWPAEAADHQHLYRSANRHSATIFPDLHDRSNKALTASTKSTALIIQRGKIRLWYVFPQETLSKQKPGVLIRRPGLSGATIAQTHLVEHKRFELLTPTMPW